MKEECSVIYGRKAIEYVIIHEPMHLKHPNHVPGFYRLSETVLSNWEKIKHKLEAVKLYKG